MLALALAAAPAPAAAGPPERSVADTVEIPAGARAKIDGRLDRTEWSDADTLAIGIGRGRSVPVFVKLDAVGLARATRPAAGPFRLALVAMKSEQERDFWPTRATLREPGGWAVARLAPSAPRR